MLHLNTRYEVADTIPFADNIILGDIMGMVEINQSPITGNQKEY